MLLPLNQAFLTKIGLTNIFYRTQQKVSLDFQVKTDVVGYKLPTKHALLLRVTITRITTK